MIKTKKTTKTWPRKGDIWTLSTVVEGDEIPYAELATPNIGGSYAKFPTSSSLDEFLSALVEAQETMGLPRVDESTPPAKKTSWWRRFFYREEASPERPSPALKPRVTSRVSWVGQAEGRTSLDLSDWEVSASEGAFTCWVEWGEPRSTASNTMDYSQLQSLIEALRWAKEEITITYHFQVWRSATLQDVLDNIEGTLVEGQRYTLATYSTEEEAHQDPHVLAGKAGVRSYRVLP